MSGPGELLCRWYRVPRSAVREAIVAKGLKTVAVVELNVVEAWEAGG